MPRDYTNKKNAAYVCNGCSNHTDKERQKDDYYATPPVATEKLMEVESFSHNVLEPCVGGGHIAEVLQKHGHTVKCIDLVDRGFPGTEVADFLEKEGEIDMDIVTNPPYKFVTDFWRKCCASITEGHKVAFMLKLTFLEGQERKELFKQYPPSRVLVFSKRIAPAMNGEFEKFPSSAIAYAWFIYEKGWKRKPEISWI